MKSIILDVDSVLLDYEKGFFEYHGIEPKSKGPFPTMSHAMGYEDLSRIESIKIDEMVREYNESVMFGEMPEVKGAQSAFSNLVDSGYKISIITACGNNGSTKKRRRFNLINSFSYSESIFFVRLGGAKTQPIAASNAKIMVDDSFRHCLTARTLDKTPIFFRSGYNENGLKRAIEEDMLIAESWEEAQELITIIGEL